LSKKIVLRRSNSPTLSYDLILGKRSFHGPGDIQANEHEDLTGARHLIDNLIWNFVGLGRSNGGPDTDSGENN
jgi:hypothetical protein